MSWNIFRKRNCDLKEKTKPKRLAKFVIYADKKGEWRWRLVAKNGRTIADGSEGYATEGNCLRALMRVIDVLSDLDNIDLVPPEHK